MSEENDVLILNKLGLTVRQAKIYLALIQTGKASVSVISKASGIDRSSTYKTILKLNMNGLVEQMFGFPILYSAVPLKEGIKTLLMQREDDFLETRAEANMLLQKTSINTGTINKKDNAEFMMVPEKGVVTKKLKIELEKTQFSANVITTANRFPQIMDYLFTTFCGMIEHGVIVRLLVEKSPSEFNAIFNKHTSAKAKALLSNPKFTIRHKISSPTHALAVYDHERALIILNPALNIEGSPAIWTNHSSIVMALEDHFDKLWNRADEYRLPECIY